MKSSYTNVLMKTLVKQIRGVAYSKSDLSSNLDESYKPVLRANNIKEGKLDFNDVVFVNKNKINDIQWIRDGDIIIAASSGSINIVGKAAQSKNNYKVSFGAFCKLLRPIDAANKYYLGYYFQSPFYRHTISNLANGANINNIRNEHIDNLSIPLPPLQTQKKIVKVLDKAQELIDLRKKQIELLDDLIQSVFYDMFGDPVTNPKGWDIKKLGNIGDLQRGKSRHRPRNAPELLGGNYPLIQTGDIANAGYYLKSYNQTYSELGLKQSKMWGKGTLCITIAANIAKTSILDFDACFPDSVVAFIPNENANNMYVQMWFGFLQNIIEASAPESAQKNINLKILGSLDIPLPPIQLQNQFAQKVQKIEGQKELMKKSLVEMENYFNSIMQKAFKGELFN